MMPPPSSLAVVPATGAARPASRLRRPSSRTRRAPRACGRRSRESRSILSFSRPGRNSLSCTTPCLMPRGLRRACASCRALVERRPRSASRSRRACRPRWRGVMSSARIWVVPASKNTVSSWLASAASRSVVQRVDAVASRRAPRACRRCGRRGSDRASPVAVRERDAALRRGSRRSSGRGAGCSPCAR